MTLTVPLPTLIIFGLGAWTFLMLFIGAYIGHRNGVKDTERRWSEAVSKANWARENDRAARQATI